VKKKIGRDVITQKTTMNLPTQATQALLGMKKLGIETQFTYQRSDQWGHILRHNKSDRIFRLSWNGNLTKCEQFFALSNYTKA